MASFERDGLPGIDGFVPGSRGSIMLDVVFAAMFLIVPLLAWSIYLVKRRRYASHKRMQILLGSVLLVTVTAFEIDMRFVSGWEERAAASPYFGRGDSPSWVHYALYVHLFFAIPTAALWVFVIAQALRRFPNPPRPTVYSQKHRRWARLAAVELVLTAATGWAFYWLAFMA